jgi:Cof subfamily protein (haloacid dehalogenase superfamily)
MRPDPHTIKALALDMDGTLLRPGNILSQRTISALKACVKRGIQLILCTGRAVEAAEPFRAAIGAEGLMVYYNGAEVVDMPGGKVLKALPLDLEAVSFCVDLSRSMGVYFQVYFPGPGYPDDPRNILAAERQSPETEMYFRHTGIQAEIRDLKEAIALQKSGGCIKCMFIGEPEALDAVRARLEERFGGRVYTARSFKTFLEVLDAGTSKGSGLQYVMERRNIAKNEIIAFGDDENDIPMFRTAGFSAAPDNAKDTVMEAAHIVIGSNAEDGVAEFLEEFFQLKKYTPA